jgi:hypothetical protein
MASGEMVKETVLREMAPGATSFCRILSKGSGATALSSKSARLKLLHINSVEK